MLTIDLIRLLRFLFSFSFVIFYNTFYIKKKYFVGRNSQKNIYILISELLNLNNHETYAFMSIIIFQKLSIYVI